jgi:hypothetical protein
MFLSSSSSDGKRLANGKKQQVTSRKRKTTKNQQENGSTYEVSFGDQEDDRRKLVVPRQVQEYGGECGFTQAPVTQPNMTLIPV